MLFEICKALLCVVGTFAGVLIMSAVTSVFLVGAFDCVRDHIRRRRK